MISAGPKIDPNKISIASPSHVAEVEVLESPLHNESPLSPPVATTLSYMRSGGSAAVTVRINAFGNNNYLDDESTVVPMPPPPPPPPESGASWDFFEPAEDSDSFRFAVHCSESREFRDEEKGDQWLHVGSDRHCMMQPLLDEKFSGNFSSAAMGNECGNSYAHCLDNSTVSRGVEGGKGMVDGEVLFKKECFFYIIFCCKMIFFLNNLLGGIFFLFFLSLDL